MIYDLKGKVPCCLPDPSTGILNAALPTYTMEIERSIVRDRTISQLMFLSVSIIAVKFTDP